MNLLTTLSTSTDPIPFVREHGVTLAARLAQPRRFLNVVSGLTPAEACAEREFWGRLTESAVGSQSPTGRNPKAKSMSQKFDMLKTMLDTVANEAEQTQVGTLGCRQHDRQQT